MPQASEPTTKWTRHVRPHGSLSPSPPHRHKGLEGEDRRLHHDGRLNTNQGMGRKGDWKEQGSGERPPRERASRTIQSMRSTGHTSQIGPVYNSSRPYQKFFITLFLHLFVCVGMHVPLYTYEGQLERKFSPTMWVPRTKLRSSVSLLAGPSTQDSDSTLTRPLSKLFRVPGQPW